MVLAAERIELTVRLDNTRPVEVSDLGQSLQALGKQYDEFVVSHGFDQTPANAQLFVTHLESVTLPPNFIQRRLESDRRFCPHGR
jgi:hypothetical protein